jgi:hypothetical protein
VEQVRCTTRKHVTSHLNMVYNILINMLYSTAH